MADPSPPMANALRQDAGPQVLEPVVLPPASPAQLLDYIVSNHAYPLTLIVGSTREEFLQALVDDVVASKSQQPVDTQARHTHPLLAASLFQIAVTKHIRLLFTPTVSHLRAYLSVFSPLDSAVPPPPGYETSAKSDNRWLVVYGMLNIHRNTSEWNAQGMMNSLSMFIDAASHTEFKPVIIEPLPIKNEENTETSMQSEYGVENQYDWQRIRAEQVPLLGYKQSSDVRLSNRTVELGKIVERWFRHLSEG
ncbi:hypothetical protein Cpir12675_006191 [Ceratocystis pirilliformis]|uniref:Uncharacterized protein n=1 Tax=Ceratocystis pirilliformis TaxID=259994 RepID=A0ABR3YK52_9PEZI